MAGDIEWARLCVDGGAPLIVWRYVAEPLWLARVLTFAVDSHSGTLAWVVEKPGRNWVLWSAKQKAEFEAGSWRTDSEYLTYLSAHDRAFCDEAHKDLKTLLEHVQKEFEGPIAAA